MPVLLSLGGGLSGEPRWWANQTWEEKDGDRSSGLWGLLTHTDMDQNTGLCVGRSQLQGHILNLRPRPLKCPKEQRAGCSVQVVSQRDKTWRGARSCSPCGGRWQQKPSRVATKCPCCGHPGPFHIAPCHALPGWWWGPRSPDGGNASTGHGALCQWALSRHHHT